ncbi:DUF262 domain-containing protein [Actinomadura hibisca]|uniref:DUF262 domain-containing protein n=1 Tax=Actinomadura hibisca TaxID=68565 RepID=UPI00082BB594|nr:DUF262 domain-containing protein [Actinomadura hibisca]
MAMAEQISIEREPLIEYDSVGASTGVERDPDIEIKEPFDPEHIDVVTRTPTVDLILSRIKNQMIDLAPDFQRAAGIWNQRNQSRLIESLLLRIPLPTFYAAEGDDGVWSIVDGIQRLTTIARFIDPDAVGMERLLLTDLDWLDGLPDGASFEDLPPRLQLRLRETELVVHLIRQGTPEPVKFNIFARINTGGLPLSQQELRHALIPGPSRALLRELAESPGFQKATGGSVKSDRMGDREMVLRFIAFYLNDPADYRHRDLDPFLREATNRINQLSEDRIDHVRRRFNLVMGVAVATFEGYAFRKRYRGETRKLPINKALFEAISVNLAKRADDELARLCSEHKQRVNDRLMDLMEDDPDFFQSISVSTGSPWSVRTRFERINELFGEVLRA